VLKTLVLWIGLVLQCSKGKHSLDRISLIFSVDQNFMLNLAFD
jgi:hypothetical protein